MMIQYDPELAERIRQTGVEALAKMLVEVQPMDKENDDASSFPIRHGYQSVNGDSGDV